MNARVAALAAALALAGTTVPACGGGRATAPPDGDGGTPPPPPPPPSTPFVAGQSYLGRDGWVEYLAGDAPVIFTAPHGGALMPAEIPDRTAAACGGAATTVTDTRTRELVLAMRERFHARSGRWPHVVIVHLSRRKLDANRTIGEAACGSTAAAQAFREWHAFIDSAKAAVVRAHGRGWYMDVHGHGHAEQRLELGYLVAASSLDLSDALLDVASIEAGSSVRAISRASAESFPALLRGPTSLGTLYARAGIRAVPSADEPGPAGQPYFNGGVNTARHSCGTLAPQSGGATQGEVCGVQVETHWTGVRDTPEHRARFGDVTAVVLDEFLRAHWGLGLVP